METELDTREYIPKKHRFKLSVIIAAYNAEDYLKETIDSILKQDLDFQKNIQLIIVDDGSEDGTKEICKKVALDYPENITYLYQENQGVSAARNKGLAFAEGEIVNFLDSDDKWGLTTLKNAQHYLDNHADVDVVSARLSLFDAVTGEHPLNYKFDKTTTKTINLLDEPANIQMNVSSSFIRRSAIKGREFDRKLKYGEDTKFLFNILKDNPRLGLLSYTEGCYWYRKRSNQKSAMDRTLETKEFYLDTIKNLHMYILKSFNGLIPKYAQFMLLYDLQWRLNIPHEKLSFLSDEIRENYYQFMKEILSSIDDEIILNPLISRLSPIMRLELLNNKYKKRDFQIELIDDQYWLYSHGHKIKNLSDWYLTQNGLFLKNNKLHLGFSMLNFVGHDVFEPVLVTNSGKVIKASKKTLLSKHYFTDKCISGNTYYRFDLNLNKEITSLQVKYLLMNDISISIKNISLPVKTNFLRFKNNFIKELKNTTVIRKEPSIYDVKKTSIFDKFKKYVFTIKLLNSKKTFKSGLYRLYALLNKKIKPKPIWVFMDRIDRGSDNAEVLFERISKTNKISCYFVIQKNCPDFNRLSERYPGKIVEYRSKRHHKLMLIADKFLCSHAEDYLFNPFGKKNGVYVRDLLDFEFIFLQHGVIQNDLSNWLNKSNKPIDKFITSAASEKQSILDSYGYLEEEVLLTGIPRYDNLELSQKINNRTIVIMPTWRPDLVKKSATQEDFLNSNYYKFYNQLFKNEELKNITYKYGVKLQFVQHPRMATKFNHYFSFPHIELLSDFSYSDLISNSGAIITDISSVSVDFAYLNKPVVYVHNELDQIYKNAVYNPGYFSFEHNGFGPICITVEDLIERIEVIVKNDFNNETKYKNRVENFFAFRDKGNSERVIKAING
ncbi:CDP-glycerol:glycerophosphate glycerophosphotransferase [Bacillus sp. 179-C3.3 HS]|uniref:CDP-glycerol:glycerophosphate glycerophosphotransferase n=1 Tax=Bacillus sp. 179-C3.3 HS TaxID=3232162 RepID=UPI0039A049F6